MGYMVAFTARDIIDVETRRFDSLTTVSANAIYRQPLTNGLSDHVWSLEEIALLAN